MLPFKLHCALFNVEVWDCCYNMELIVCLKIFSSIWNIYFTSVSLSLPSRNGCGWLATTYELSSTLPVVPESQWTTPSRSYTTSSVDTPRLSASLRGRASQSWPIGTEKSAPTLAPYRRGPWPHCSKYSMTYSSSVKGIRGALHCWFVSNQSLKNDLCCIITDSSRTYFRCIIQKLIIEWYFSAMLLLLSLLIFYNLYLL